MTKITVSRAFCGRRVITVGKDDRTYFARQFGRNGWDVFAGHERIGNTDKVRMIEFVVRNHLSQFN